MNYYLLAQNVAEAAEKTTEAVDKADKAGIKEGVKKIPVWDLIIDGGIVMIPLAIMSIFAVYIFVERFMAIQKAQKEEKNFMSQIKSFIQNGDLNSAKNLCQVTNHPIARMIGKGISKIGKPITDIRTSVENQGRLEVGGLERRMSILATISGAAPMIGFLGTTLGMIRSFNDMASADSVKLGEIAPGMMQAMVTTVGGLIVGIIAYMAYNYLASKVDSIVHKMESTAVDFFDLLDKPSN